LILYHGVGGVDHLSGWQEKRNGVRKKILTLVILPFNEQSLQKRATRFTSTGHLALYFLQHFKCCSLNEPQVWRLLESKTFPWFLEFLHLLLLPRQN
jgi:hypothetical protein